MLSLHRTRFDFVASTVAGLAGVVLAVTTSACAAKGFTPRIISESVIVRSENAGPGSSAATAKTPDGRSRAAAKTRPGVAAPRRVDGRAVGTRGLTDPSADAIGTAPAPSQNTAPVASGPASPATPAPAKKASTTLAAMAGGGWLVGLVLAGALTCVVVYRRRPFRVY